MASIQFVHEGTREEILNALRARHQQEANKPAEQRSGVNVLADKVVDALTSYVESFEPGTVLQIQAHVHVGRGASKAMPEDV